MLGRSSLVLFFIMTNESAVTIEAIFRAHQLEQLLVMFCRTQNVSGHFNLANYSESILSLTFSNANKNVLML